MESPIINCLNEEQKDAVLSDNGPILVLAGPGTGKTRVLVARYIHLFSREILPQINNCKDSREILAMTFTNKAANEILERVFHGIDISSRNNFRKPWIGTFHGICVRILRDHTEDIGYRRDWQIINMADQAKILKKIFEKRSILDRPLQKSIIALISKKKELGIGDFSEISKISPSIKIQEIATEYQDVLKAANAMDFSDIINNTIKLFTEKQEILAKYQSLFSHILVDEYQDTNISQRYLLQLLSKKHRNIFCVGDDDQSIYSWRGAVGSVLEFENDFAIDESGNSIATKIVKLRQNYRSTQEIISTAQSLIEKNSRRMQKPLISANNLHGEEISVTQYHEPQDEAADIISQIIKSRSSSGDFSDFAILVRNNSQIRIFEEEFTKNKIPYRVIGDMKFYDYKEIRDAIAYLRAAVYIDDDLSFDRIMNVPRRGFGSTFIGKLKDISMKKKISVQSAMQIFLDSEINPNGDSLFASSKITQQQDAMIKLLAVLKKSRDQLSDERIDEKPSVASVLCDLLTESKYIAMLLESDKIEKTDRLANVNELIKITKDFSSVRDFFDHITLASGAANDNLSAVSIMTMHAAKGLEFEHVFLPGWENSLLPSGKAIEQNGIVGLEEERRLAYVAITRAKKTACISYCVARQVEGMWRGAVKSCFIDDIAIAEKINHQKNRNTPNNIYNRNYAKSSDMTIGIKSDTVVSHDKFGIGIVDSVAGDVVTVRFENCVKKILKDFLSF